MDLQKREGDKVAIILNKPEDGYLRNVIAPHLGWFARMVFLYKLADGKRAGKPVVAIVPSDQLLEISSGMADSGTEQLPKAMAGLVGSAEVSTLLSASHAINAFVADDFLQGLDPMRANQAKRPVVDMDGAGHPKK